MSRQVRDRLVQEFQLSLSESKVCVLLEINPSQAIIGLEAVLEFIRQCKKILDEEARRGNYNL